nr:MAG TPA: Neurotoxin magi-4, toxin, sodium channel inhibitor [Bacteriophage sp.]
MCGVVWYAEGCVVERCCCGVSCYAVWYYVYVNLDERKK